MHLVAGGEEGGEDEVAGEAHEANEEDEGHGAVLEARNGALHVGADKHLAQLVEQLVATRVHQDLAAKSRGSEIS